jgi:N-acetylglutamate synthase-like GNAT family acetyltransferase
MSFVTIIRDIHIARIEADVRQCWLAFHELRPHLQSEDEFVERWRKQVEEGYQIIYVKDGDKVVAAAGYRFLNTMAWGHILYIDDLVALQTSQRTDLGTLLLQHLQNEARERGCEAVYVDTGYPGYRLSTSSESYG